MWAGFRAPTAELKNWWVVRKILSCSLGASEFVAAVQTLSSFHLASASQDEDQDGLDQSGGSERTAADLAEDAPALELGVRAFARATLAGVGGVDLALVAR
jgi:hypothetical protein